MIQEVQLCKPEECTGCLACYNSCNKKSIKIQLNDEGFWYPQIDSDKCVNCGLCVSSCPISNPSNRGKENPVVYAAWSKDQDIHLKSSSGGVFSELSKFVLSKGGVIYGASLNEDWTVSHEGITSEQKLLKLRGSKYLQSYQGDCYSEVKETLQQGRCVLYSGTPCQIAGLYSFLQSTHTNEQLLLTVDLVCHGVPTPVVFKDYISYLERKHRSKIINYSFRDKYWSWLRYNTRATFSSVFTKPYKGKWEEDVYMRGFLREYFLRESCHQCKYACHKRQGDITLADFWNYRKQEGELDNKDRGVSMVMINSEKGLLLFNQIKDNIICYLRTADQAYQGNQAFNKCFPASPQRDAFWKDYREKGFEYLVDKYLYSEVVHPMFKKRYQYGRRFEPIADFFINHWEGVKYRVRKMLASNRERL